MILVTGATGNAGGAVLSALVDAGEEVLALVRAGTESKLPRGAEVVTGDLNRPDTLAEAIAGASAAFLLSGYEGIGETLAYMAFPREHWRSLRTNNPLERVMRELRRRTRVVGCFPDGDSAVMLVGARLRHLAGTKWGTRRYLDMGRLVVAGEEISATA